MMAPADIARWLYTPRRIGLLVFGLLVLLVLVVVVRNDDEEPAGTSRPAPGPAASSPSPSSSPTPVGVDEALETATTFVELWASDGPSNEWLAALMPYTDEELARRLALTDPSHVPATEVEGKARLTDTASTRVTQVAVGTDAGPVSVGLRREAGRWLVYDIQPGAQQEAG